MNTSFRCIAFTANEQPTEILSFSGIESSLARRDGVLFIDVTDPQDSDFERLARLLDLHPLAIEDARKAHQRPKIEPYRNSWFIVAHVAARPNRILRITELALFCGDGFVVAVHAEGNNLCAEVEQRWAQRRPEVGHGIAAVLYAIFDAVVDSYMPLGEALENEIDTLEEGLFTDRTTTREILLEVFRLKNDLGTFRRAVAPMRDILSPIVRGEFKGFTGEDLAYFRDIDDHVARLVDSLDGAKEALINAGEAHIAFASHRQNEVTKQLSIVATIFLPLTFITGFFGQNFGWLVTRIDGASHFFIYGLGTEVIAVIMLLGYFRYKRWF